jgi:hypothetical protein
MHLVSLALLVCIASSGLAWLAALAPGLGGLVTFIYALTGVAWVACWLLDEPIQGYLGVEEMFYQACLMGFAIAAVLGGMARLCLTWLG